jgi:ArsR family transcriptional regulator, arsenate/arsenite/antimonite-responsive transcriptional repressor
VGAQEMYQALADPTRREILRLLREGDLAAGEIAGHFEISWPAVSRHLGVLANADLVHATRHGSNLVYTLTTSVLQDIATEVADLAHVGRASPTKARRRQTREART